MALIPFLKAQRSAISQDLDFALTFTRNIPERLMAGLQRLEPRHDRYSLTFEGVPKEDLLDFFKPIPLWVSNYTGVLANQAPEFATRRELAAMSQTRSVWPVYPLYVPPLSAPRLSWVSELDGHEVDVWLDNDSSFSIEAGYCPHTTAYAGGYAGQMGLAVPAPVAAKDVPHTEGRPADLDLAAGVVRKLFEEEAPKYYGAPPVEVIKAYLAANLGLNIDVSERSLTSFGSAHTLSYWVRIGKWMEDVSVPRTDPLPGMSSWHLAPWISFSPNVVRS